MYTHPCFLFCNPFACIFHASLFLLTPEFQRLAEEVAAELAELRTRAAMNEEELSEQLVVARHDLRVAEKRAEGVEVELAAVRAEAMRLKQDLQNRR
jgi:hypothetical protein